MHLRLLQGCRWMGGPLRMGTIIRRSGRPGPVRSPMPEDKAYLSVVQWPDCLGEAGQIDAVARATGLDAYQAGLVARRGVPQVLARMNPADADRGTMLLRELGASAFAPRRSEMGAAP